MRVFPIPALLLWLVSSLHAQALTPADSARHLLNRLTFGPAPGQVASVVEAGALRWADRLLVEQRPDDPALHRRETAFDPQRFAADELAERIQAAQQQRRRRQEDSLAGRPDGAMMMEDAPRRVLAAYQQLTMVRAVTAEDQLREVMADFWTNHFNVYLDKGADRALLPEFIERTIRPMALGRFEDLLLATAHSPAMLFYLDNARSVRPGAVPPRAQRLALPPMPNGRGRHPYYFDPRRAERRDSLRRVMEARQQRAPTGINENYARELLELHTLGVDGGYTQHDVTEVARILTGWGIANGPRGTRFEFHDWAHDDKAAVVLGETFKGGGEKEGERLLRMLANHPATMHHVSRKLCARFVADDPPDGCVDDAVRAWQASHGEILAVLRAIVHSPDFWSPRAVGSKVKSPLEFVASAARALAIEPDTLPALSQAVGRLGQPLFRQASPAGYPEREDDWVNSGALLERMNLAVALAGGRLPGAQPALDTLVPSGGSPDALLDTINDRLFAGSLSSTTRAAIARELAESRNPAEARALAVGLALGSPEFQRQ